MALQQFQRIGNGDITSMTEDFCTYVVDDVPITARELQVFLEEGWEQMGSPVTIKVTRGIQQIHYNFRNVSNV